MDNNIGNPEFEEMKQQISLLKKKLEQQTIINTAQLKKAMAVNLNKMNRHGIWITILGILTALLCPLYFYQILGASIYYTVATGLMLIYCAIASYRNHSILWKISLSDDNLLETIQKVAALKQHYVNWHRTAIPMLLLWFGWTILEVYKTQQGDTFLYLLIGIIFGGLIGGTIGHRTNKRVIRETEIFLDQAKELNQYKTI